GVTLEAKADVGPDDGSLEGRAVRTEDAALDRSAALGQDEPHLDLRRAKVRQRLLLRRRVALRARADQPGLADRGDLEAAVGAGDGRRGIVERGIGPRRVSSRDPDARAGDGLALLVDDHALRARPGADGEFEERFLARVHVDELEALLALELDVIRTRLE